MLVESGLVNMYKHLHRRGYFTCFNCKVNLIIMHQVHYNRGGVFFQNSYGASVLFWDFFLFVFNVIFWKTSRCISWELHGVINRSHLVCASVTPRFPEACQPLCGLHQASSASCHCSLHCVCVEFDLRKHWRENWEGMQRIWCYPNRANSF